MEATARFRKRMDRFAEWMARKQTALFLNVFYVLVVPVAHAWLRLRGQLHHETTGFFREVTKHSELGDHRKQY